MPDQKHVQPIFVCLFFKLKGLGHLALAFPNCHFQWGPHISIVSHLRGSVSSLLYQQLIARHSSPNGGVQAPWIPGREKNQGKEKHRAHRFHMLSLLLLVVLFDMSLCIPRCWPLQGPFLGVSLIENQPWKVGQVPPVVCKESTSPGVFGVEFQGTDDKLLVLSCFLVVGLSPRQPGCRSLGKVRFMFRELCG